MQHYHHHDLECEDPALCEALERDPEFHSHHIPGFITGGDCAELVIAHGDAAQAFLGNIGARDQYLARMRDFQARQTAARQQQQRRTWASRAQWN